MPLRQFYLETDPDHPPRAGDLVLLDRDESHHLFTVLRGGRDPELEEELDELVDLDELEFEEELERIAAQVTEHNYIPYGANMKLDPNILMLLGLAGGENGEKTEDVAERLNNIQRLAEEQFGAMHPYGKQVSHMLSVLKETKENSS